MEKNPHQTQLVLVPDVPSYAEQYIRQVYKEQKQQRAIDEDFVIDLSELKQKYEVAPPLGADGRVEKYIVKHGNDTPEDNQYAARAEKCIAKYYVKWDIRSADGKLINTQSRHQANVVEAKGGKARNAIIHGLFLAVTSMRRGEEAWFVVPQEYQAPQGVSVQNASAESTLYFFIRVHDITYHADAQAFNSNDLAARFERYEQGVTAGLTNFRANLFDKAAAEFLKASRQVEYMTLPRAIRESLSLREAGSVLYRYLRALINHAQCLLRSDKREQARVEYEKILEAHPFTRSENQAKSSSEAQSIVQSATINPFSGEGFDEEYTRDLQVQQYVKAAYNLAKIYVESGSQVQRAVGLLQKCKSLQADNKDVDALIARAHKEARDQHAQTGKNPYKNLSERMEEIERREKIEKRLREREAQAQEEQRLKEIADMQKLLETGQNEMTSVQMDEYLRHLERR